MSDASIMFEYDDRTSTLKEYYSRYLISVRGLTQSSVAHYIDALNNISRRLREKNLVNKDIYEIMNLEQLSYIRNVLFNDPDFIVQNERGRRMYSAGLNNYYRFASGEGFQKSKEVIAAFDIPLQPEEPVVVQQTIYKRSEILRTQALTIANYKCEIDGDHQSFIAENTKKPYMEGHHAIPMRLQDSFDHSLDVYANLVCLCPVCHRRIHYGIVDDRKQMLKLIYHNRADRLANSGIKLGMDEFTHMVIDS